MCYNVSGILDIVFKTCPKDSIIIKGLKQKIIKTLVDSDTSQNVFNEELLLRIQNNTIHSNINSSQPEIVSEEMAM